VSPARKTKALRWERRPDDRIPELLEAALHVFADMGYRRTRLDDVAERAGVTKGTIYHYFDTKEALLLGVVEHYQALAFESIDDAVANPELSERERLQQVVKRAFVPTHTEGRPLLTLLMRDIATEVPRVHERWLRDGPGRLGKVIADIIDQGQRNGEFAASIDAEIAARSLVASLLLQLMWRQHREAVPHLDIAESRLIDGALDLLLAALRPGPRSAKVK
jgi:AcrR family transcriptional regulator